MAKTRINVNSLMSQLQNPANWKRTRKKKYYIYMCRPHLGTKCHNHLEGTDYTTDQKRQFILSGWLGEQWVVDAATLARTYELHNERITPEALKRMCDSEGRIGWKEIWTKENSATCWAFFLPKSIQNFPVQTSWGDILYANRPGIKHNLGDFILASNMNGQPNLNELRVVNGEVFPRTYDLHAFPNMYSEKELGGNPVVPKSIFNDANMNTK